MRRVAIVQARMGSARLPGKSLADLAGRPMIQQVVRRLRRCRELDAVVLATTVAPRDDALADAARATGLECFRGSEDDVLARFSGAAEAAGADVVVRVTGDCPLIDAGVVDRVVRELTDHASACDYASNVVKRTYPRGLDTEAFWRDTLARMDRLGTSRAAREHVTVVARLERPELFLCRDVTGTRDASGHRWTVDTGDDLDFVRGLYRDLGLDDGRGSWEDVLAFLDAHPERIRVDAEQTWDPGRKS